MEKNQKLLEYARLNRNNATPQEKLLWYSYLRKYPIHFQRQKVFENYIADFYCAKAKLIVELDGSQHYEEKSVDYDKQRDLFFESNGIKVIRFLNRDIDSNLQNICAYIDKIVATRIIELNNKD